MTVAVDTFAHLRGHARRRARRPRGDRRGAGAAAALLAVPLRPDDQVASRASRRSAFRRRILLERAAYRMITTRAPLIDIAVEAGYGSHEAFTRAFTQAYGAPPAAWRRKPGHLQIPAPSGVHFHPPGSLRLPARDKVTPMELLTKMVEHHIWLTGEMVRLAERLTDEQLDEEIELNVDDDRQTIRSLLSPADRPDGDVERRDGHPRLRLVGRGARVAELDARAAGDGGPDVPHPRPRRRRPRPRSTTRSSTRCASRPRCSPTAG